MSLGKCAAPDHTEVRGNTGHGSHSILLKCTEFRILERLWCHGGMFGVYISGCNTLRWCFAFVVMPTPTAGVAAGSQVEVWRLRGSTCDRSGSNPDPWLPSSSTHCLPLCSFLIQFEMAPTSVFFKQWSKDCLYQSESLDAH